MSGPMEFGISDGVSGPSLATEVHGFRLLRYQIGAWVSRQRRRFPHLVWRGNEVDVRVRFKGIGTFGGAGSMEVFEAQRILGLVGIGFDTGSDCGGRDWEWDFSLHGPVSVTFVGRARNPERRVAQPMLRIVPRGNR